MKLGRQVKEKRTASPSPPHLPPTFLEQQRYYHSPHPPTCKLNKNKSQYVGDFFFFLKLRVFGPVAAEKYLTTAVGPVNIFLGVPRLPNYPSCAAKAPSGMFSRELAHSRCAALISAVRDQAARALAFPLPSLISDHKIQLSPQGLH